MCAVVMIGSSTRRGECITALIVVLVCATDISPQVTNDTAIAALLK